MHCIVNWNANYYSDVFRFDEIKCFIIYTQKNVKSSNDNLSLTCHNMRPLQFADFLLDFAYSRSVNNNKTQYLLCFQNFHFFFFAFLSVFAKNSILKNRSWLHQYSWLNNLGHFEITCQPQLMRKTCTNNNFCKFGLTTECTKDCGPHNCPCVWLRVCALKSVFYATQAPF